MFGKNEQPTRILAAFYGDPEPTGVHSKPQGGIVRARGEVPGSASEKTDRTSRKCRTLIHRRKARGASGSGRVRSPAANTTRMAGRRRHLAGRRVAKVEAAGVDASA